ncbi:hypothetical protein GCM10020219_067230 [Nonomuraea dietziae]
MPRSRIAIFAAVTIILGLATRPLSKYAGDAFYTVLLYWVVLFVAPRARAGGGGPDRSGRELGDRVRPAAGPAEGPGTGAGQHLQPA